MIGIIGAMEEEVSQLIEAMEEHKFLQIVLM